MKKLTIVGSAVVLAVFLSMGVLSAQQTPPAQTSQQGGWSGPQSGGWYCPRSGRGMEPGMMHGGRWMGPGMMHGGRWMCPYAGQTQPQQAKPLTKKDAGQILENYIGSSNNPNLRLGDITEKDNYFEAAIVTKEGSLVDRIEVDKNTGWFRSIY